ncbi:hypothetical protein [Paraburkholderia sp. J8-2]|uniref:hypothetical protein n=1 Tax=Paraburkholderia sp. J8-2 TaxID=2805440 RepID=UPI002AB60FE4|nr:hypothetical protein [Paraburkholderia sp. J8-2]
MTGMNPLAVDIFFGAAQLRGHVASFASLRAGLSRRYQALFPTDFDASRMERPVQRG